MAISYVSPDMGCLLCILKQQLFFLFLPDNDYFFNSNKWKHFFISPQVTAFPLQQKLFIVIGFLILPRQQQSNHGGVK